MAKIPDHVANRRLQPDTMLEDLVRRRRYLIAFETGSATIRNSQHKTATLTKFGRYSGFLRWPPATTKGRKMAARALPRPKK